MSTTQTIRISRNATCIVLLFAATILGQQHIASDLFKPLAAINQKSVTATVTFLASDEMAGRETPSKELEIAEAYVAARFRGAGLIGGGDKQSFFQPAEIATLKLPEHGIKLFQDGKPLVHFGLLSGDAHPFSFRGPVEFVSAKRDLRRLRFTGPVCFLVDDLQDQRALSILKRQTAILRQNGATAILIPVSLQHPLVNLAAQKQEPSIVQPSGDFAGPVLLTSILNEKSEIEIEIPEFEGGTAIVRNVIGILPGSDPDLKQEALIFTAHLDHIGHTTGTGDTVFNGADDDASGVTAVLSLADAFATLPTPPKRTVIFMTYWGEEKGLLGSRFYAKYPRWPLEKTIANINIEMIGRPEPGAHEKCWVTGWDKSNLGELMNEGAQRVGVLIFEHPQFSEMLYRASDNYSLAEKGVIAHSFSAGSLHSDYHQVGDEWEKLELRHMTRVIEGLFAGSLPIAKGEVTPVKRE